MLEKQGRRGRPLGKDPEVEESCSEPVEPRWGSHRLAWGRPASSLMNIFRTSACPNEPRPSQSLN